MRFKEALMKTEQYFIFAIIYHLDVSDISPLF